MLYWNAAHQILLQVLRLLFMVAEDGQLCVCRLCAPKLEPHMLKPQTLSLFPAVRLSKLPARNASN